MRGTLGFALALLLGAGGATAGDWSYDAQAGVGYDSNPGNAGSAHDEQPEALVGAGAGASYALPFGLFSALQLRAALDAEGATDHTRLSSAGASARLRLLAKPGSGFFVPVLAAWVGGGARQYGSTLRSGYDYRGGLSVTESLTTAIRLRVEATAARRESDSRVFDLDEQAYALALDWSLGGAATLYAEFRQRDGDLVVSAEGGGVTPKSEHLYLATYADAIEPDDAFNEGDNDDWNAFRIPADTRLITVGLNLPLSGSMSLDAQLRQSHATAGFSGSAYGYDGFSYDRWLAGLALLARF